jgi:hypothetical protein
MEIKKWTVKTAKNGFYSMITVTNKCKKIK